MRLILKTIASLLVTGNLAMAQWSIEDLNKAIDSTNFIVGSGCSGTLISVSERLILTNHHCVEKYITSVEQERTSKDIVRKVKIRRYLEVMVAQKSNIDYSFVRSASYLTDIAAEERNKDLALLRIKDPSIPQTYASPLLPDGDKVTRGEIVYIVGNPLGEDATLLTGVVSRLRKVVFPWANGSEVDVIQHTGGIAGGNSGGALYNARGQLIGVPAAGYSMASSIGYSVSVEFVKLFLRENCFARVISKALEADDKKCEAARKKQNDLVATKEETAE